VSIPLLVTGWTPPDVAPLTASVRALAGLGEAPWPAEFFGSAEGGTAPYEWAWSFGDGSTSSVENATHVYDLEGNFAVNLTVTDAAGRTELTGTDVYVFGALAVSVTGSRSTWVEGSPATVIANASGGHGPFNFSWGPLPRWCAASSETVLTCTPSASGNVSLHVTAVDALGYVAGGWYNTTIPAAPGSSAAVASSVPLAVGVVVVAGLGAVAFLLVRRRTRGA
jgi:PKD repeat protein